MAADNLGPGPRGGRRPFQRGAAQGEAPGGGNANEAKDWLIDTGAEISAISQANAAHFVTTPTGGSARGVNGAPITVVRGVTMLFKIATDDPAYPGGERTVSCDLPVAVTPRSDILGMDQLGVHHVRVSWDPERRTGRLFEVAAKRRG
jgi:hypothetical protein